MNWRLVFKKLRSPDRHLFRQDYLLRLTIMLAQSKEKAVKPRTTAKSIKALFDTVVPSGISE